MVGKLCRTAILVRESIRYYPKYLDNRDADLAIVVDERARKEIDDGSFTLSKYRERHSVFDAGADRKISNFVTLGRLSNELARINEDVTRLPKKPVDYWRLSPTEVIGQSIIDRADDFPFVHTVATICFGMLLSRSLRKHAAENRRRAAYSMRMTLRERHVALTIGLLIWLMMQAGHFFGGDYGPLHGTLRTTDFRLEIQITQWTDSVLYFIVSWVTGFFVVIYWRQLNVLIAKPDQLLKKKWLNILEAAVNAGIVPLTLVVGAFLGFLFGNTWGIQFLPVSITGYAYTSILYLLVIGPAVATLVKRPAAVKVWWNGIALSFALDESR